MVGTLKNVREMSLVYEKKKKCKKDSNLISYVFAVTL